MNMRESQNANLSGLTARNSFSFVRISDLIK